MLRVHFITVGKLKEKFYQEAREEYIKRLKGYCKWTHHQIGEEKLPSSPSQSEIDKALAKEAKEILGKIPEKSLVVVLCVEGKAMPSEKMAELITQSQLGAEKQVVFVVGGSYGLADSVKAVGSVKLSMSPMTFPHHLAQIMLLEQIYRGFKIQEGSSYHK